MYKLRFKLKYPGKKVEPTIVCWVPGELVVRPLLEIKMIKFMVKNMNKNFINAVRGVGSPFYESIS